jgi:hypothetical protein
VWDSEELEAEADRVYRLISGLEGSERAEAWSLSLALLLGPGQVKGREQVALFKKRRPKVRRNQGARVYMGRMITGVQIDVGLLLL